jgi:serine/threonine protein kinase
VERQLLTATVSFSTPSPPFLSLQNHAQEQSANRWCAMKIIRKDVVIKLKQVEHTLNEKNILSCIDCPFIIHLWEFFQVRANVWTLIEWVIPLRVVTWAIPKELKPAME